MRIAIVGAGAVGSFLGASLAGSGHDVTLVDRSFAPVADERRLDLVEPDGTRRAVPVVRRLLEQRLPEAELVVLAVKMFDLAAAADLLRSAGRIPALTVQNGVGAEDLVSGERPDAGHIAASLTAAVARGPAGEVRRLRRGGIGLAAFRGEVTPVIAELAGSFRAAGLPAATFADANAMKWSKLLTNLAGNATSALLDMDPAELYADAALYALDRRQLLEALDVMSAQGLRPVALPGANARLLAWALRLPEAASRPLLAGAVGAGRGGKMPSLRIHLREASGPTEVRWMNGAVAAEADRYGRASPVNARLAALVEEASADPERRAWFLSRPDRLLAEFRAA